MGKPQTIKDKKGSVNAMGLKNSFEQLYANTVLYNFLLYATSFKLLYAYIQLLILDLLGGYQANVQTYFN